MALDLTGLEISKFFSKEVQTLYVPSEAGEVDTSVNWMRSICSYNAIFMLHQGPARASHGYKTIFEITVKSSKRRSVLTWKMDKQTHFRIFYNTHYFCHAQKINIIYAPKLIGKLEFNIKINITLFAPEINANIY